MVRPRRCRRIGWGPRYNSFGPRGGGRGRKFFSEYEVVLGLDELESIRLKDYLELEQKECAERMGISQPTFSRTLTGARKKVARALIECGGIKIRSIPNTLIKNNFKNKRGD